MSDRFVLRLRRAGSITEEELARIRGLSGVDVIEASPRMVLVEGDESYLAAFVADEPDWVLLPGDINYEVPDTRLKPKPPD